MVRLWCYLGLIVADVSSQTASGPCNHSRSIKCMPLGVTVAQGWNVSLRWNPAGCTEFFPFCNYFELCVILRDGHTTIPKAISSKPPDCEGQVSERAHTTGMKKTGGQLLQQSWCACGVCVNVLSTWKPLAVASWSISQPVHDCSGQCRIRFGRNANWNLISYSQRKLPEQSTNTRAKQELRGEGRTSAGPDHLI